MLQLLVVLKLQARWWLFLTFLISMKSHPLLHFSHLVREEDLDVCWYFFGLSISNCLLNGFFVPWVSLTCFLDFLLFLLLRMKTRTETVNLWSSLL